MTILGKAVDHMRKQAQIAIILIKKGNLSLAEIHLDESNLYAASLYDYIAFHGSVPTGYDAALRLNAKANHLFITSNGYGPAVR